MYRYLQAHTGWFDSPAWKVEGDYHIPRLVGAFERLAEYVAAADDDDPRFVSLAAALNDAQWAPEDLDGYLYSHIVSTYGVAGTSHEPDGFITGYVPIAVGIIRANAKRRS
jgi:hypothetical protein